MGAAAVREAVRRASPLEAADIDDVIMGCAMPEGQQGLNMGRLIALRAGLGDEVTAQTANRFCSSGLQTIALAAQQILAGMGEVVVAGGTERRRRLERHQRLHRSRPSARTSAATVPASPSSARTA